MRKKILFVFFAFLILSCQVFTGGGGNTTANPDQIFSQNSNSQDFNSSFTPEAPKTAPTISSLNNELTSQFSINSLKTWPGAPYLIQGDSLPIQLEETRNPPVVAELTQDQRNFLAAQGFTVIHNQEEQFGDIREQVSTFYGQPYYLTTDAAFHALHLTFDEMLKLLEKEVLKQEAVDIIRTLLTQTARYSPESNNTAIESDRQLAQDYLAVALGLFTAGQGIDVDMLKHIQPQIDQIMAGNGREKSMLIPNFEDDYGAYKPVGHYAGDADLENYFRGMTWLGKVEFKYRDADNPEFKPNRVPLILTLALREAELNGNPLAQKYSRLMETMTFLIGPTDDGGPVETGALMDAVYGKDILFSDLADDEKWQVFQSRIDELPRPRINSTFVNSTMALNAARGWRLMGQRFTLDGLIFQNMIYDKVGSSEKKREFPSGLDVMAVLGSEAALQAQKSAGQTDYKNYLTQMDKMKQHVQSQTQPEWLDNFYSSWLFAFLPEVQSKHENFPPLMRTPAWQNRELTSALGSWGELQHDTTLYAKMPEFMAGGGPPASPPAPGYVEPNPDVFYRLGYTATALHDGLESRGYIPADPEFTGSGGELTFNDLWNGMGQLGELFIQLGDIAAKELAGQYLTLEEYELIQSPLGPIESHVEYAKRTGQQMEMPPVPVIAAVSGAGNEVLQAGVGNVDRIYVVVPIDGRLAIAQGGVFSYYEFRQPRAERLTDEDWLARLTDSPPDLPAYTGNYLLPGGQPVDALAFRVGDVYIITEKGGNPPLNLRTQPTKSASIVEKIPQDTYLEIIDGPMKADGLMWWKARIFGSEAEGWIAENQEWYVRAHGQ